MPRDAATAGTDLDQLDRCDKRIGDWETAGFDKAPLPRLLEAVGNQWLAAIDQPGLAVVPPMSKASTSSTPSHAPKSRGRNPRRRAAFEHLDGIAVDLGGMRQPAAGQHQQQRCRDAEPGQFLRQSSEIAGRDRFNIPPPTRVSLIFTDTGLEHVEGPQPPRLSGRSAIRKETVAAA